MVMVSEFVLSYLQGALPNRSHLRPSGRAFSAVALLFVIGEVGEARAQELPGTTDRALPGILRVGAPVPAEHKVRAAASGGYGWYESFADIDGSTNRLYGNLAASYSPLSTLTLGFDAQGRYDNSTAEGAKSTLYGEPTLTARYAQPILDEIHLGVQFDLRVIGGIAPGIIPKAMSPALRAQIAARLAKQTWLAAEIGFHLDLSENAIEEGKYASTVQNLTIGASSSPSIPWGVGLSHRFGQSGTELLGEFSGDTLVGNAAPSFGESPLRLSLGARQPLREGLSLGGTVNFGLSARPDLVPTPPEAYVPREPRISAALTIAWQWDKQEKGVVPELAPKPVEKAPPPPPPPEPLIQTAPVTGSVVDEGGRPLPDVEVVLTRKGAEPIKMHSAADGQFEFPDVPLEGEVQLVLKTPGYEKVSLSYAEGKDRNSEIVMYPALPAGQVRGAILDLSGRPVAAKITITPGDVEIQVQEDGSFELELAPGNYTVRFSHDDFKNQKRDIVVQDRGVVILNIALAP